MGDAGTVHVIDDDEAVRDSLLFLFNAAALRAVAYDSADSFLAALPTLGHACIVTDVRMPGLSGLDLLQRMQRLDKQLPVIVVTGHSDVPMAVQALKAGAFDFIEKPFEDERIIAAVRSALALRGEARRRDQDRDDALRRLDTLTERERQVLDGLVAGQRNKIIAGELGISPRTVEVYRANVMNKLKANSLSEVVRLAVRAQEVVSPIAGVDEG